MAVTTEAFSGWAALGAAEHASYLRQCAQRMLEDKDGLLNLEVRDTGNTIRKMAWEVDRGAEALDYYAGLVLEFKGETIPATADNLHLSFREPFGVVSRIIPFNHPIEFASSKAAATLAAGNTLVIKPSDQPPSPPSASPRSAETSSPRYGQHRDRARPGGRRRPGAASADQAAGVHRLGPDRDGHPAGGVGVGGEGFLAGARWEKPGDRLPQGRPRPKPSRRRSTG